MFVPEAGPGPTAPPAAAAAPLASIKPGTLEHDNTWDLNLDGAFGRFFGDDGDRWTGFGRVRAGGLFIRDSLYWSVGGTYELSNLSKATFGAQAEVMHIEIGYWAQVGAMVDVAGHPGAMAAVGWSLFGVEAQVRDYANDGLGSGVAVYAKIRVPVSVIARVFRKPPKPAPKAPAATASPAPASP